MHDQRLIVDLWSITRPVSVDWTQLISDESDTIFRDNIIIILGPINITLYISQCINLCQPRERDSPLYCLKRQYPGAVRTILKVIYEKITHSVEPNGSMVLDGTHLMC